ncbi:MAG: hypothetical protein IJ937_10985 [Treponema sp.]|nr:hypothetical protein [Treponema sp.]
MDIITKKNLSSSSRKNLQKISVKINFSFKKFDDALKLIKFLNTNTFLGKESSMDKKVRALKKALDQFVADYYELPHYGGYNIGANSIHPFPATERVTPSIP